MDLRGQCAIALGPGHQPDEHCAVLDDERRHPEDAPLGDRLLVRPLDLVDRATALHFGQDLVGGGALGVQDAGHDGAVPDVESLVVPGREQGVVHRGELLGILVTHDDARRQCDQLVELRRIVPHRGSPLGHVALAEGEGHERDVPIGPVGQPGEQVLVDITGERASVVEGHGEWLHNFFNREPPGPIPLAVRSAVLTRRRRLPGVTRLSTGRSVSPRSEPMAAPPTTSLG